MSIYLNIFLSLFISILNLPSPMKINSFTPFYITKNEILFEYEYKSQKKVDIVCIFKPYFNEVIFGKLALSKNITDFQKLNSNEIKYINEFIFNGLNSIIINSTNIFNEGEGIYYIYLIGNLACSFEIFLINEIQILDIKDNYFYTYLLNYVSQNYFSLKIENLKEDIYINILLHNKNCSSIEIKKRGDIINCNSEIKNLLFLEKNNEYFIKYNLEVFNYLAINFQSELIHSLDEKSINFYTLSGSVFNFSINIKDYKIDDYFGFVIDHQIKFSIEADYLEKNNLELFKPNIKSIHHNFFITQKKSNKFDYFIFKIKFFNNYFNKIIIKKINEINFIKQLPFSYNIKQNKTYLFVFSKELLNFFKNYKSYVKIRFDHENAMNIILNNNKYIKDRLFVSQIDEINAIIIMKIDKDGLFEINMLSENYNQLINSNYLITNSEKTFFYSSNIGEKFEIVPFGNRKIFCYNLLVGNMDIYEVSDINEKANNTYTQFEGLRELKNQTLILKLKTNAFSLYEIFYQNYEKNLHIIGKNSKMLYFSKYIKYQVFILYNNTKLGIKLLNPDSELNLIYNKTENNINLSNPFIELENIDKIEIEGNNNLVHFFVPITNNQNYIISNLQVDNFNSIKEIFIIPNKTNNDIINLILTIDQSDDDEIIISYFIDYNIIPYSRNKIDLINKINLKKGVKESIIINNYLKNDNVTHLKNENFYIFISFQNNVSMNYELKYSDYQILNENSQILMPSGKNKIYLGYEKNNYLKFDKCGTKEITLDIYQKEEISHSNIKVSDNDLISCSRNDGRGYLSVEINSEEEFLISLSHNNYSSFDNIIYNYEIKLSMDKKRNNVIINYYPISNYPQVEYHIYIIEKKYYNNLTDHCFINKYINNIYTKKYMILSNGEEEIFNQYLNITNEIKCNDTYSFIIIAKEVINEYPNYHFYNPQNYYIECKGTDIYEEDETDKIIDISFIKTLFILGFDGFVYNIENKECIFNCYFYKIEQTNFPNEIYLYINVKENNDNEEMKPKCNLVSNDIRNQIKYECKFLTNGKELSNVKFLDILETDSHKDEIQKSSFLQLSYKNNIQNAKGDIFNKSLFFLEDPIINYNEKEFNITGNLKEEEFNYNQLLLQFHSDSNNTEIKNSTCLVIKSNEKKFILKCNSNNPINTTIVDGYSNLGDGHLFVVFQKKEYLIEMKQNSTKEKIPIGNRKKDKGISKGAIIAIIISIIAFLLVVTFVVIIIYKKRKKSENMNKIDKQEDKSSSNNIRTDTTQ